MERTLYRQVPQDKVAAQAKEVPALKRDPAPELRWKLQKMSKIQSVTSPDTNKVRYTSMWISCARSVGWTWCCAASAALAPSSNELACMQSRIPIDMRPKGPRVCLVCTPRLSDQAHAPSPCISTTQKPLEINKHAMVELF
jgi:hypothetical protein